jgi:hypothetical protein
VSEMNPVHGVLPERMPHQIPRREAKAANTPPAPVFIRAP